MRVFDASDPLRAKLPDQLRGLVDQLLKHRLIDDAETVMSRMTVCETLQEAVTGASYVQESVVEVIGPKRRVSEEIDRHLAPGAIVGSSTSGFPASSFTEFCVNRDRYIVAHPVNPPHLIPVVEIVPAPWTAPDTVDQVRALMDSVGQACVSVKREIPGFILNRLQGALLDEAWSLFEQGFASAEDIDKTVKFGLGLRWSFIGPFETIDLNAPGGIDDYARRLGPMYAELGAGRKKPGPWSEDAIRRATAERRAALPAEDLDSRRSWRDDRLMALQAAKAGLD